MYHDIIDSDLAKIQSQLDRNHGTLYVPNDGVMIGNRGTTPPKWLMRHVVDGWMDEVRYPHPFRRTKRVHGERGTTRRGPRHKRQTERARKRDDFGDASESDGHVFLI